MINIDKAYKQFKLSNDDEIVCEVLEWNNEENDAIIVRNVMKVVFMEDFEKGIRFYAFRPWMVFVDDPSEVHTINSGHIVAEITPSADILKHYVKSLNEINEQLKVKKKRKMMSLDDLAGKMQELDDEEFEMYLQQLAEIADDESDSDMPQNVIKFKPKSTLH